MTLEPAVPPHPSEPATQAYAYDPWAPVPPATAQSAPPAPVPPAAVPPDAPVAPFPAGPAHHGGASTLRHAPTAAYPVVPAQFSAPPVTAQFSAPPAQFPAVRPGPHPPVPAPPPAGHLSVPPPAVAVQIGEIMVTPPVIRTPAGVLPLAGTAWHVVDHWQKEEKIATWALVCAILGFFCLTFFSLLFLLVKETRHHGTVQVTVTNGAHQYVARIPVADQGQVQHINNQVNYARSLSTR